MTWRLRVQTANCFFLYFVLPWLMSNSRALFVYFFLVLLAAGRLTPAAQRGLTLIAKILQNLSNSVAFGDKEAYMQPLNPLLTQNFPVIAAFLLDFVDLAKNAQIEHNPLFFSDVHAVAAVATTSSVASLAAEPAQSVSATSSDTAATAANQD